MLSLQVLIAAVVILGLINAGIALRKGYISLGSCPKGGLIWFHPMLIPALALAPAFPPRDWLGQYNGRFSLYAKKGSTILSGLWVWCARPMFWIADAEALKIITAERYTFTKDVAAYSMVDIYGKSLVSTEGNEWRRHVAVAGPAFGDSINALVWKETLRLVHEWITDELESAVTGLTIEVNMLQKMTQMTLHVIAAAGFGMRLPWSAFSNKDYGAQSVDERLPFHIALDRTLENLPVRVLVPSFLYSLRVRVPWLSDKIAEARHAFASMKSHMADLVGSVRDEVKANGVPKNVMDDEKVEESSADLLRRLVEANEAVDESGARNKRALSDNELYSNIFTFLLAGHETSAHTLGFAILLLAVYPEAQSRLREEVYRIWPSEDDEHSSSYKRDFEQFEYAAAFFRETLRCFPTEPRLIKQTNVDTTLPVRQFRPASGPAINTPDPSFDGASTNVEFKRDLPGEERTLIHVPKGSIIVLDIWGVQMNPMVWGSDAHLFRPERFIDTADYKWPREGFMAFSSGVRGCIGQRFALSEAVSTLASLVRRYEVLPIIDPQRFTSHEEFKLAMLGYSVGLTITPTTKLVKLRRLGRST